MSYVKGELLHHMLLMECPFVSQEDLTKFSTPGEDKDVPCISLLDSWGVGSKDYCTPGPVSSNAEYGVFLELKKNRVYAFQFHFDNPEMKSGVRSQVGVNITVIPKSAMASKGNIFLCFCTSLPIPNSSDI